jgi:hypothetical protein
MQRHVNNEDFIDLIEEINPPIGNIYIKDKKPLNTFIRDFMIHIKNYSSIVFYLNSYIVRIECKISEIDRHRYINYDINEKYKINYTDKTMNHLNRLGGINKIISKCDFLEELYIYDDCINRDTFLTEKLINDITNLHISYIYNSNFTFLKSVKGKISLECFDIKHLLNFDFIEMLNCEELIINRFELLGKDILYKDLQYFIDSFNILVHNVKIVQINEIVSYKSFYNFSSFLRSIRDNLNHKINVESINKFLIY